MRTQKLTSIGLLTLGVLIALALASTPALAGIGHGLAGSFGGASTDPPDPYPLSLSASESHALGGYQNVPGSGVAVDDVTHDVYAIDKNNYRVEKLDSSGHFLLMFGANVGGPGVDTCTSSCSRGTFSERPGQFGEPSWIAVDNSGGPSTGDVYVGENGGVEHAKRVEKFTSEGVYVSQITGPDPTTIFSFIEGVGVDPDGDLWIHSGQVYEFDPEGHLITSFACPGCNYHSGLAVDANNVYVGGEYEVGVLVFARSGGFLNTIPIGGEFVFGLASDATHGDLYFDEGKTETAGLSIKEYETSGITSSSSGSLVQRFGSGSLAYGSGVAVDPGSGTVYVANEATSQINVYDAGPVPGRPLSRTGVVSGVRAVLGGELRGGESGFYFAYKEGTSGCEGGGGTPEREASGTVKVSAEVSEGLEPEAEYSFCLVAKNKFGEEFGSPSIFRTEASVPTVETVGASKVGPFGATIDASVNPEKQDTTCVFEYGETETYGSTAPCEPGDLGSGFGGAAASLRLEGLRPSKTYYFRVIAKNATGSSEGSGEFTTAPELGATIKEQSVSVEQQAKTGSGEEATLKALVNPNLQETISCMFEYGRSGRSYEASVPCEPSEHLGSSGNDVPVSAVVKGLVVGVDYHYRVVVANKTAISDGADQVFGPPTVLTGSVLSGVPGVAPGTTATVGGEIDPQALDTRYYIQYGTSSEYGQSAPALFTIDAGSASTPLVLGAKDAPPTVPLEGLSAGAVYYYRLVAENADGTTYGEQMTLMVPADPVVGPASVSEVTQSSATITTTVAPGGLHTLYTLDLGTSTAYGTPYPGDAGSGSAPVTLTFNLDGLEAGTTYHFRVVAANSDGTTIEPDRVFTTLSTPAGVLPVFAIPSSPPLLSFIAIAFPTTAGITTAKTTTKVLTRAQKLANALRACQKKPKSKRAECERQAHSRYASKNKKRDGGSGRTRVKRK